MITELPRNIGDKSRTNILRTYHSYLSDEDKAKISYPLFQYEIDRKGKKKFLLFKGKGGNIDIPNILSFYVIGGKGQREYLENALPARYFSFIMIVGEIDIDIESIRKLLSVNGKMMYVGTSHPGKFISNKKIDSNVSDKILSCVFEVYGMELKYVKHDDNNMYRVELDKIKSDIFW